MLMQAIETNSCYIVINKIIERVSVEALDFMDRKDIITIFLRRRGITPQLS